MKPKTFMLIAGEASGDTLAAELVAALRAKMLEVESAPTDDMQPLRTPLAPRFFGAGGPKLAAAGVELAFDLTQHSLIGIAEVFQKLVQFRRMFLRLLRLAAERQPDVIIGVDYGGFNLRFARAIRRYVRRRLGWFQPWNPKLVQFVSPQVWASRPGRAFALEKNCDLLLSIFPFEQEWYARRVPKLQVKFVGHPIVDRFHKSDIRNSSSGTAAHPSVTFLPGSRADEMRRHWPVVTGTFEWLRRAKPALRGRVVLPDEGLVQAARSLGAPAGLDLQAGRLSAVLADSDLAITKSGTITVECALHGLPALVFYKTSWANYLIGKQIVKVKHLAMPNLLAGEELYPEFVQHAATPQNLSRAAMALLDDPAGREVIKTKLAKTVASLGGPGANTRAAEAIAELLR